MHPRRPGPLLAALALIGLAVAASASAGSYTIRRGDTLGGVARRLGVTVDALARANHIRNPNRILAGQVLVVPASAGPTKRAATGKAAPATATTPLAVQPIASVKVVATGLPPTYIVQKGNVASAIAKRYQVKLSALAKANPGVNVDRIQPGTVLHIPAAPVWICPVQGPHSWRDDWGAFRADTGFHSGNDVLAPRGTPVVAPVGGTLELRQGRIGGNAFYLKGDDGHTYYGAHLDAYSAGAGRIEAGQQIGVVGDTGDAKGGATHLHFELHPNGGPAVDPYFTLATWC